MFHNMPHRRSGNAYRRCRIGLLGGSFNPAHEGHVHISLLAVKQLRLDQLWWLVSPQNPLKSSQGMASFGQRVAAARAQVKGHPRLIVSTLENQLGSPYTANTLRLLKQRFARTRFIWLMGADNLLQIPRWQHWQRIFTTTPVAVYRRPPYAVGVLRGQAARRYAAFRLKPSQGALLGRSTPPKWILCNNRLNRLSATAIRAQEPKPSP